MLQWNGRLLLRAFTVPFPFDFAACATDESTTRAPLWLDTEECTNAAHKLPLHLELRLLGLRGAPRAIIQRH